MKILIDARMIAWTGIGRYTEELLGQLEKIDTDHDYLVLMRPEDRDRWTPHNPRFSVVEVSIRPYGFAEQWALPRLLNRLQPDLVHFPHFTVPLLYRRPFVMTLHDLTLMRYLNLRGGLMRRLVYRLKSVVMRYVVTSALRRAIVVITDTEAVKTDLNKTLGVPNEKMRAIALASNPLLNEPAPIDRLNLPQSYLLHVGNVYPYKNLRLVIDAIAKLAPSRPELKLVLVGKSDSFFDGLRTYAEELGVAERIIFTGFVTNGELVSLYKHATLYVLPSKAEGFGLPGLEAMTQGTPVLAANATCLPEVYADAAEYFDPLEVDDLVRKINALLDDPKRRSELRTAGYRRLKDFSWEETAKQTLAVYVDTLKR